MSTVLFTRGLRRAGPVAAAQDTELQEPPVVPEPSNSGIGSVLMYAPLGLGSLAMMMMFIRPNAGPVAYLGFGLMLVSVLFMGIVPFFRNARDHKERLHGERRDYLRSLAQTRRRVRSSILTQYQATRWIHPDPDGLWSMALSHRLWERRLADEYPWLANAQTYGEDAAGSGGPLRITVIGGGPVALIFCALIVSGMPADDARIRIFDSRWYVRHGRVLWKDAQHGNRRRRQVVTVQSRQYTLLPEPLFRHAFRESVAGAIWPTGADSVNGLAPLNIRITDLEDGLLDWAQSYRQIEFHPARFDAERQLDDLRGEHLVVICDGAGSRTRESLGIFGRPDADSFTRGGRKLEDVVLGLEVKSRLPSSAAVVLTVAQSRFLLNPGIDGKGFLNMRLTDDEAIEVHGTHPTCPHRACPCTQGRPCLPERRFGHSSATARDGSVFAPSRPDADSRLWPRIVDGLNLFGVDSDDLKSITSFRLFMVERPRFAAVLFHQTATRPATIAALLGDAAISVHLWPGRGLNTGIGSALSLAETVIAAWRRRSFREADFAVFEARMAQLQFRNQVRGFYGSMRVDDTTGEVTPIRDLIGRSYVRGRPTLVQHRLNRAILSDRLCIVRENLASRLPTDLPSQDLIEAQVDLVTSETVAALVASGPWDTYRPGGPEVDLWLTSKYRMT